MSLFNFSSNGKSNELDLIKSDLYTRLIAAEGEKLKGEGQKIKAESERAQLPLLQSKLIRDELSGWSSIIKYGGIGLIAIIAIFGGLSAVAAIWEFIAPHWYFWLGGLVLVLLIWR